MSITCTSHVFVVVSTVVEFKRKSKKYLCLTSLSQHANTASSVFTSLPTSKVDENTFRPTVFPPLPLHSDAPRRGHLHFFAESQRARISSRYQSQPRRVELDVEMCAGGSSHSFFFHLAAEYTFAEVSTFVVGGFCFHFPPSKTLRRAGRTVAHRG